VGEIARAFQGGGFFMYFILLFGVMTISLVIERASFFLKVKSPPNNFRKQVMGLIIRGDYQAAEDLAKSAGNCSLGRIVEIGARLRSNGAGEEEVQARMDDKLSHEISAIDRRTGFLAMFGNVSTLLGLLGTITGMIHSFGAVASASPVDRATMLSKGISEAMNCTAFGLVIAIPALVAYAYFQNKTDRLITDVTEATTEIYHDLVFLADTPAETTSTIKTNAGKRSSPELSV
jgi:biopolymer transport protein ExbB